MSVTDRFFPARPAGDEKADSNDLNSPSLRVVDVPIGMGVVAARAARSGEVVGRYRGRVLSWGHVPYPEKPYVMPTPEGLWMIPEAPERFINHSCSPNCRLEGSRDFVALRDIAEGEEITFAYDVMPLEAADFEVYPVEYTRWDHAFTFVCACGSPVCRGVIDRNRFE